MKLVLASQNQKKLREMREILAGLGVEVVLLSELGMQVNVEETGLTFLENARLKSQAVMEATGLAAIADDSGLVVDALNGAPGVYSARYGGPDLDDAGRYQLLLEQMQGQDDRKCRFVCTIVCSFPQGDEIVAEGVCQGVIAKAPRGSGGFGYDPVFFLPDLEKTMAELTPEEKHQISHRGGALRQFANAFAQRMGRELERRQDPLALTGKQRAYLRSMANGAETVLHIGKDGISAPVINQADDALEARELIKCRVLENAGLTAREACEALAKATRSEPVQVIGSKFVLYRKSHKKGIKHIPLPVKK